MKSECERWKRIRRAFTALGIGILPIGAAASDKATLADVPSRQESAVEPQSLLAPWPMFRHDARHSGRTPVVGAQTAALRWQASIAPGAILKSSPAIGRDGAIYIGTHGLEPSGLVALNPDGTIRWMRPTRAGILESSPAIGRDGTVYVGSNDNYLWAVRPDGSVKWRISITVTFSPTIGPDGTIYVSEMGSCYEGGCGPSSLYAFRPDGTVKWRFLMQPYFGTSVAIALDGTIYTSGGDRLVAVDSSGNLKWTVQTNGEVTTSPAVGPFGTVYIGTSTGYVHAVNPDGTMRWSTLSMTCLVVLCGISGSPAVTRDGTIVVGDLLGHVTALTPGGAIKWTYLTSNCSRTGPPFPLPRLCSVESSPAVGGDGTVYVGSYALDTSVNPPVVYGYVSAIDDAGALKWRYDLGGCELSGCEVLSSPAIGADGAVYVGSGAYVYAFGPGPNSASAP